MSYADDAVSVAASIKDAGSLYTFTRTVLTPNFIQDTVVTTVTTFSLYGVVVRPIKRAIEEEFDAGTLAFERRRGLLCAAGTTNPQTGDTVVLGGSPWTVISASSIMPDGSTVLFTTLQIQRD